MRAVAEDFLPLTAGYFEILLSLSAGEAHGYAIMQQVAARTDGKVRLLPGTMYRAFNRLQDQGLIDEGGERPDAALDDQRRRYYRLTDLGRAVASAEARRLSASVRFAAEHDLLSESDS